MMKQRLWITVWKCKCGEQKVVEWGKETDADSYCKKCGKFTMSPVYKGEDNEDAPNDI